MTMPPIRLKTGRVLTFSWNEQDNAFVPSANGGDLTDAEWDELDRILRARRAA